MRQFGLLARAAVLWIGSAPAFAAGLQECSATLLAPTWPSLQLVSSQQFLGAWPLPRAPGNPDRLTAARASVETIPSLEKAPDGGSLWDLDVTFSYPTEGFGLFFTFQGILVEWRTPGQTERQARVLDWSEGCESPGRSLAPGGAWSVRVPVGAPSRVIDVRVSVYGSQN